MKRLINGVERHTSSVELVADGKRRTSMASRQIERGKRVSESEREKEKNKYKEGKLVSQRGRASLLEGSI